MVNGLYCLNNNLTTFIPNCFGTPTDLKRLCSYFQLAQINILQQALKEQVANIKYCSAVFLH